MVIYSYMLKSQETLDKKVNTIFFFKQKYVDYLDGLLIEVYFGLI